MSRPPKEDEATASAGEAPEAEAAAAADPGAPDAPAAEPVRAPLEPIGTVRRELVRPDGKKVYVDVPVYPPFRLTEGDAGNVPKPPPRRLRPGAKPRKTGSD
jgi:hypothetical protein